MTTLGVLVIGMSNLGIFQPVLQNAYYSLNDVRDKMKLLDGGFSGHSGISFEDADIRFTGFSMGGMLASMFSVYYNQQSEGKEAWVKTVAFAPFYYNSAQIPKKTTENTTTRHTTYTFKSDNYSNNILCKLARAQSGTKVEVIDAPGTHNIIQYLRKLNEMWIKWSADPGNNAHAGGDGGVEDDFVITTDPGEIKIGSDSCLLQPKTTMLPPTMLPPTMLPPEQTWGSGGGVVTAQRQNVALALLAAGCCLAASLL
jgi:hypothetical protein